MTSFNYSFNDKIMQVLVATGSGKLALYDYRARNKGMYRKYKGCVGGIRSIYCLKDRPYFASVGLDRFLRIYNVNSQKPIQKLYLKSQLNCVLLTKDFDPCESAMAEKLQKEKEKSKAKNDEVAIISNKSVSEFQQDEDGDEFWKKLKVIKSGAKSRGAKTSANNPEESQATKKRKLK